MRIRNGLLLGFLCVSAAFGRTVTVTILATTDMHGNLLAWAYYTAKPADRGLAKIATLIKSARAANPNTLLIDCGDTIQGAPLESVYQYYVRHGSLPLGVRLSEPLTGDPMMRAMNALGYDAMVVGNHEFNFGLKNLAAARATAQFPWLSANTKTTPGSSDKPFQPYIVKTVGGVKIAVVGVTTPGIPQWDEPANWKGYEFLPAQAATEAAVAEVRAKEKPDVIVVAAHMGLGADLASGQASAEDIPGENAIYQIAKTVPGIDGIAFGHTHNQLAGARIGDVLVVQPKNWAISMAQLDFTLDDAGGKWNVVSKTSKLIPAGKDVPEDPEIVRI